MKSRCKKWWKPGLLCISLVICLTLVIPENTQAEETICQGATTTVEMEKCLQSLLEKAMQFLMELQSKLLSILKDNESEAFRTANSTWMQYRDANCKSASILYRGGSMEWLSMVACKARMTEERSKEIMLIYEELLRDGNKSK